MTDNDFHNVLYEICSSYSKRLNGISYGTRYDFDRECFTLIIKYSYADSSVSTYTESIPEYIKDFDVQSARAKLETLLRYLITRSFRMEVNHLFGKDFNPL